MARFIALILLGILATSALGADLPSGDMLVLDGKIGPEEWKSALRMDLAGGTAYLRTAGRVLCLGIEIPRPYRGERIDLRVAGPGGDIVSLFRITPAGFLPRAPFTPLPPLLLRRSAWETHNTASYSTVYSSRLRCQVLGAAAKSWSMEFCISLAALNLPHDKPFALHLSIAPARRGAEPPFQVPPARWPQVRAEWDIKAPLYVTEEEDGVNKWALELFAETLDIALKRKVAKPRISAAFDNTFDRAKVDAQLAACARELSIAPARLHGLWYRCHLLRRANRLVEADAAYRELIQRLPDARALPPVAQERTMLLLTACRFDDFEKENRGIDPRVIDRMIGIRTSWEREQAWIEAARGPRPRFEIETTRGRVVVELYEFREPGYDKLISGWLAAGGYKDIKPTWATGGLGFAFGGMDRAARCGKADERRLAWRGTLAMLPDRTLVLTTGHLHLYRKSCTLGRVIEGMKIVDALGATDRIISAKLVQPEARD